MKQPSSLADIWSLYVVAIQSRHPLQRAQSILTQTETALNRYTLPGFGLEPFKGRKPTRSETQAALTFQQTVTLETFQTALEAQERTFERLQPSASSQAVYRSRLREFLSWCQQQDWWPGNTLPDRPVDQCAQRRRRGHGQMAATLLTHRCGGLPRYGLKSEQISQELLDQIERFYQFRTSPYWPGRLQDPVKPRACRNQIGLLFHLLGWFHRYRGVPLEKLSLSTLVPFTEIKYATSKEAAATTSARIADYVDGWVCEFCNFLIEQRGAKSPHTRKNYLCALLAVAKFQYHTEITSRDYREVPAMEVLRRRLSLGTKELKNHTPVAALDKKWLELPEVLQRIVEPLRSECQPKLACGSPRSLKALAGSIQRYVLWGDLTYTPPRRQQELRDLKVAISCPVKRPDDVPTDGLYQPLPTGRHRDRDCGYLYRTPDGRWIKDMTPESYKTGKTYGHQELVIPNIQFPDGRCFYDYLEMWLYGYYKAPDGSLRSCGTGFHPDHPEVGPLWPCRLRFDPVGEFVFVQHNGRPFDAGSMASYMSTAAHTLTGQRLTPHLLRDIFATHFLDQGASDAQIASLAYAMGHSPQVLRTIYDRRRPAQKHRPIQVAVLELVQQCLHPS